MSAGSRKFAPLFSVWQIDAWADGEEGWTWNDKMKLFSFRTEAMDPKRVFLSRLRRYLRNYVSPMGMPEPHDLGYGWYYVTDDWYCMEIHRKCDGCPYYACIRETPI